jgi:hypothetical protein
MAKTTPLTAQERVILFCTATGVSHAAVGITAHAMQSMATKGFIVHDRESGLCPHGQRTRCAPCDPRGCGADIDRAGRREQRYEPTREGAMAAFAKSWWRESAARDKPSRQLGNGGLPRPRA